VSFDFTNCVHSFGMKVIRIQFLRSQHFVAGNSVRNPMPVRRRSHEAQTVKDEGIKAR
jgi:hypothetical protein